MNQVVSAFLAVLRRPRFGFKVEVMDERRLFVQADVSGPDGSIVSLWFIGSAVHPRISVIVSQMEPKFRFNAEISASDTANVRKLATIFARKLHASPAFDVMHQ